MIMIDRDQIAQMIPHAGTMCLLDGVLHWNDTAVRCVSRRYRDADNPLRRADGTLGMACGIELAAQAMAVHGYLTAGHDAPPAAGYLASVRDVSLANGRFDAAGGDLMIDAERLLGDTSGATYRFVLASDGIELLGGRATVLLRVSP